MTIIAVSDDILLRKLRRSDAAELFGLVDANREHLARWLPWVHKVRTLDDERAWIRSRLSRNGDASELPLLIVREGRIIGAIGLHHIYPLNDAGEIGYWIAEEAQGQGIVTRACAAVLDYAFNERKMNRVQIRAAVGNTRSRAVPERLGFICEGIQREGMRIGYEYHDTAVYSVLAREWWLRRRTREAV